LKEFIQRTLSGAIFVAIMLTAIWYHAYSLVALLMFLGVVALTEFFNMNRLHEKKSLRFIILVGGLCILLINFLVASGWFKPVYLLADIAIMMVLQILPMLMDKTENFNRSFAFTTSALVYVLLPLSLIPFICFLSGEYDFRLMFGFFILLWTFDSFAYLTGVLIGKHRILPAISPKKSWEGFAGGLVFSVAMAYPVSLVFPILPFPEWMGLAIIIVVFGTLGDFLESSLKRNAGIKDSGRILPGHGGILDRFDSVLFSIPFFYLYLALLIS